LAGARAGSSLRLVVTLAAAGLLSGLVLVGVYLGTQPRIEANREAALRRAITKVLPGTATIDPVEPGGGGETVWAGLDESGKPLGYAIPAEGPGFMDTIKLIYGLDPRRGVIVGMEVLESRETPGLGDKIVADPDFHTNFDGLAVRPSIVAVKKGRKTADNQVDCITGATISSEAVVSILGRSASRWLPVLAEDRSGADGGS